MAAPENNLHEREILIRDTFTPAENSCYFILLAVAAFSFFVADPATLWTLGFILITLPLSIATIRLHQIHHPFVIDNLWAKYAILTLPVSYLTLHYCIGLFFPALEAFNFKNKVFWTLSDITPLTPIIGVYSNKVPISLFGFFGAFLATIQLYLIPKSLFFNERLLSRLCVLVAVLVFIGYLQHILGLSAPILTKGITASNFFAFFPYDGHWAAFASIWCGVFFTLAIKHADAQTDQRFIDSKGPYYLSVGVLLGFSGYWVHASMPSIILLLTFSVFLLIFGIHFSVYSKDAHSKSIVNLSIFTSCVILASSLIKIFTIAEWSGDKSLLRQTAWKLFLDRPLFGWGYQSFEFVAPFYNDDILNGKNYISASSDFLEILAEFGLIGAILIFTFFAIPIILHFAQRRFSLFSKYLLGSSITVIPFAVYDTPLMSPAVFVSFLIVFFIALRWAKIERSKEDELDALPELILPESDRSIPFHNAKYKEKFK